MKQTTTIVSDKGTFTTETEVEELSSVTLDASLFDAPSDCRSIELPAGIASAAESAPAPAAAPEATAPTPTPSSPSPSASAPAPANIAPKAAGVIRIGVVKLSDQTNQGLPTDNLILDLESEITNRSMEAVALTADAPPQDVVSEAKAKNCDYILYTTFKAVGDPGSALPAASLPKGVTLDAANAQALTNMTLYKVNKPLAEIKDLPLAADAPKLAVDAVSATFGKIADKIVEQVKEDAHPAKTAVKTTKKVK